MLGIRSYRESDTFFSSAVDTAAKLCEDLDVPAEMPVERRRRIPRQFEYEDGDDLSSMLRTNSKCSSFFTYSTSLLCPLLNGSTYVD